MLRLEFEMLKLSKYLENLAKPKTVHKAVKKGLAKVGIEVKRKVTPKTPRDTGELLNSWKVESDTLSIEMGYDIIYAMYQHQGRRQDGSYIIVNRPAGGETYFLKNALEENYDTILQIFAKTIENELIKP